MPPVFSSTRRLCVLAGSFRQLPPAVFVGDQLPAPAPAPVATVVKVVESTPVTVAGDAPVSENIVSENIVHGSSDVSQLGDQEPLEVVPPASVAARSAWRHQRQRSLLDVHRDLVGSGGSHSVLGALPLLWLVVVCACF